MNKNVKIAKQLIKLAKSLIALDEEGDGSGFQMQHDYANREQNLLDMAQKQGKKYILHHNEHGFWRIQACRNFGNVKKGDFGGLIESEKNLSHKDDCWVYGFALVRDNSIVCENALINGDAKIFNNAKISGDTHIDGHVIIADSAKITGGCISGSTQIYDNAIIDGNILCVITGNVKIHGNAYIWDRPSIEGQVEICGKAKVIEEAIIRDNAKIYGNACVKGCAIISGKAKIHGNAKVDYDVKDQEITK